jgi:hypothetical protein
MAIMPVFVPGREFFGLDTIRLSAGGYRFYALDTVTKILTVLDAKTGAEIGVFPEIGETPSSIADLVPIRAP